MKWFLFLIAVLSVQNVQAEIIQILHTNDTHSFVEHTVHNPNAGGFIRTKKLIEKFTQEMKDKGIKTYKFDAGDYLEGNLFFLANKGQQSLKAYNSMNYDFSVLGNHDYQIGINELDQLFGTVPPNAKVLSANVNINPKFKNLKNVVKPFYEFKINDSKIAIFGLTTNEIVYKWAFPKDSILDPIDVGLDLEKELKKRGNNFVIALTHIGINEDIKLADKSKYIDLIIGGHSHTVLTKPKLIENKSKRLIPIVHAGSYTKYLGRLLIDFTKGKHPKLISYELVPIEYSDDLFDSELEQIIHEANEKLEEDYNKDWLNETIGKSDLVPGDKNGHKKWALFISDAMRRSTGADIAIHSPDMNGANYPVGEINRKMIFNSIPRVFDFKDKFGWDIYTVTVRGAWIQYFLKVVAFAGDPLAISGVKANIEYGKDSIGIIRNIRINGQKLKLYKNYKIVFTEGIIKGAAGISDMSFKILKNPARTGKKVWASIEALLKEYKISFEALKSDNHLFIE